MADQLIVLPHLEAPPRASAGEEDLHFTPPPPVEEEQPWPQQRWAWGNVQWQPSDNFEELPQFPIIRFEEEYCLDAKPPWPVALASVPLGNDEEAPAGLIYFQLAEEDAGPLFAPWVWRNALYAPPDSEELPQFATIRIEEDSRFDIASRWVQALGPGAMAFLGAEELILILKRFRRPDHLRAGTRTEC